MINCTGVCFLSSQRVYIYSGFRETLRTAIGINDILCVARRIYIQNRSIEAVFITHTTRYMYRKLTAQLFPGHKARHRAHLELSPPPYIYTRTSARQLTSPIYTRSSYYISEEKKRQALRSDFTLRSSRQPYTAR